MAQITLVTGVPGDGKSLYCIWRGLQFVAEGRTVYAAGFKDLDYEKTGFLPLPTPFEAFDRENLDDVQPVPNVKPDWMLLEDAVIIYDECYGVIPARSPSSKVPVHVDALARHRHYNIDLIFCTQKHEQIDSFVRGLIKEHIHIKRRFGFDMAVLKEWDGFQRDTKGTPDRSTLWKYPKHVYSLYKSATTHTIKKRIPWYLWAPIPLVAMIAGLVYYVTQSFGAKSAPSPAAALAATGGGAGIARKSSDDGHDALRQADYAAWIKPRVSGMPWTAPAYDQLRVATVPKLYCISVEDGDCKCVTEQGTDYELEARTCRAIAKGGSYNPFIKPLEERSERRVASRREGRELRDLVQPTNAAEAGGAVSSWTASAMRSSYTPPELTHAPSE